MYLCGSVPNICPLVPYIQYFIEISLQMGVLWQIGVNRRCLYMGSIFRTEPIWLIFISKVYVHVIYMSNFIKIVDIMFNFKSGVYIMGALPSRGIFVDDGGWTKIDRRRRLKRL